MYNKDMNKIMLVEDDQDIAHLIKQQLQKWDYEVFCCTHFDQILEDFQTFQPHLVLLDITLPYFNGYHWCQHIRKISKVPIIFVSSSSDNMNLIMAIEMGGDDFIAKPFDFNVLLAKIQAMMRRTYAYPTKQVYSLVNQVILDVEEMALLHHGQKLVMARNEFRILKALLEHRGQVISRNILMQEIWQTDEFIDENTLTVNMGRLRKTLESIGIYDLIETRKGYGYVIGKENI